VHGGRFNPMTNVQKDRFGNRVDCQVTVTSIADDRLVGSGWA
jgi:hypothetical protein